MYFDETHKQTSMDDESFVKTHYEWFERRDEIPMKTVVVFSQHTAGMCNPLPQLASVEPKTERLFDSTVRRSIFSSFRSSSYFFSIN